MKDARLLIEHIRVAMRFIVMHVKSKDALAHDLVLRYAVERNFEIIGEATKRLPDSLREQHPDIPWREMAGMRDMIIHQYDEIDIDEVWTAIEKNLPRVLALIDKLAEESL